MKQYPLKILTLDGGGLQALATLSSIGAVCKAVATQNGSSRIPAPHELFDIICGVGTGGWIALLLGRYCLDIATCMEVYMEVASRLDVESDRSTIRRRERQFKLDQHRLLAVVRQVLRRYGLSSNLLPEAFEARSPAPNHVSRCKYSFAAGVVHDPETAETEYQLFRAYTLDSGRLKAGLPGPDPAKCPTAEVFAALGAAKFFLKPYKVGTTTFFDGTFPQSHPITSLALDEAFNILGSDIEIDVLLNIGPGIPSASDCAELSSMVSGPVARLTRRFSWPKGKRLLMLQRIIGAGESQSQSERKSSASLNSSQSALQAEGERRCLVQDRLADKYGESGPGRYHHIGPDYSEDKSSLNDVSALSTVESQKTEARLRADAEIEHLVKQYWIGAAA